jgi:ClpX C4-type zinc finger protein/ClpA/ClpB-like protein
MDAGIRDASHRLFGPPGTPGTETPPMSAEATCALDAAAHTAATGNPHPGQPPEVRTEHLLAVLALDPGGRARRVLNDLGADIAAVIRELQCHLRINPARPARWWKRRPPERSGCSFCGHSDTTPDRLVNGPGVAICGACIAMATDILAIG